MNEQLRNLQRKLYFESPQNRWRCAAGSVLLAIGVPATFFAAGAYSSSEGQRAAYAQHCLDPEDPSINYCDYPDNSGPEVSSALHLVANSIAIDAIGGSLVYSAARSRKKGKDINYGKVRQDIDDLRIEDKALILHGEQLDTPPPDPIA